jgi:multisubunit Na+/H+ antiporter MnhE subunit
MSAGEGHGRNVRGLLAGVLEIAWWWGACTGIWLLTLSSVTLPDLITAAGCGLLCAVAARAARRAMGGRWRPRLAWLAWLPPLLASVAADEIRVMALAARRLAGAADPGRFKEVAMPAGERADVAAAHRAAAIMTVSATPGTFVADADPEEGKLVIHFLADGAPNLDRTVTR